MRLTLKEYGDYVTSHGFAERVHNALSIREIPEGDLSDTEARAELMDRALAGDECYAFVPEGSSQYTLFVWQGRNDLSPEFNPMDWTTLWRMGCQPDPTGGFRGYMDMRDLPLPSAKQQRVKKAPGMLGRLLRRDDAKE